MVLAIGDLSLSGILSLKQDDLTIVRALFRSQAPLWAGTKPAFSLSQQETPGQISISWGPLSQKSGSPREDQKCLLLEYLHSCQDRHSTVPGQHGGKLTVEPRAFISFKSCRSRKEAATKISSIGHWPFSHCYDKMLTERTRGYLGSQSLRGERCRSGNTSSYGDITRWGGGSHGRP